MKISANSIRAGNVLLHDNELWVVAKTPEHTKPGKGGAYVQVEMKNLKKHNKLLHRFSSTDQVERAELEQKTLQFLYMEDSHLILMDTETFEQISVNKDLAGKGLAFIVDGMLLTVETYEEQILDIRLPSTVVAEIAETVPSIKGATVTASYKPATLTNGVKITVPPYLTSGEKIIIKTEDFSFVERAK